MLSIKYVIISSVKSQNCEKIPIYIIEPSDSQLQIKLKEFSLAEERKDGKMGPLGIAQ